MKKRIERKIGYFSGLKEEFIEQKKETEEILENHIFSVEISPKFYLQKKNKSIQDHEKIYLKIEEEMKSLILSVKARSLFMKEDDFDNLQYPSDWGWKMSFLLISFLSEKFKIIFDNYKNNKNTILNPEELMATQVIEACDGARIFAKELISKFDQKVSFLEGEIKKLEATIKSP